jgi:hypothetical protein
MKVAPHFHVKTYTQQKEGGGVEEEEEEEEEEEVNYHMNYLFRRWVV